jgi:hypothetical protein
VTDKKKFSLVTDDEWLARFILFSKWIRPSDHTVRPEAFIPHPYPDLSVTRHKDLSERELWQIGEGVANARPAKLYGRTDIQVTELQRQALTVESKPVANNPNHANVIGWPVEKSAQKSIAQQLVAGRPFISKPTQTV